jgi:hypothetical protein
MTAAVAEHQELQAVEEVRQPSAITPAAPPSVIALNPMAMIAQALDRGATPELIDKLFDWQDRLEKKSAIRDFDAAFAAAKGKFPKIVKDANVAFKAKNGGADTDYWHETLAGIAEAVNGPLAEHGLAYSWEPKQLDGGRIEVTCILSHIGGHSRRASLAGSPDASGNKNNLQAVASTVSYLERYTLKAILGIASSYDDDGQGGATNFQPDPGRTQQRSPAEPARPAQKISPAQAAELSIRLEAAKGRGADEAQFWIFAQATKVEDVTTDRLPIIISALKTRYGV